MKYSLAILADANDSDVQLAPIPSLIDGLKALFDDIFICADDVQPYWDTRLPVVSSLFPHSRQAGNLHSALITAHPDNWGVVAIQAYDPLPPIDLLNFLAQHPSQAKILIAEVQGQLQPFPGRYQKGCIKPLRRALLDGHFDLLEILPALHPSRLLEEELAKAKVWATFKPESPLTRI